MLQLRLQVEALQKDYAAKLSTMGQMVVGVVLSIPMEGALSMALERDPQLLECAFSKNIILTFSTSLPAILKGLAMTIQQAAELYKRFTTCIDSSTTSATTSLA